MANFDDLWGPVNNVPACSSNCCLGRAPWLTGGPDIKKIFPVTKISEEGAKQMGVDLGSGTDFTAVTVRLPAFEDNRLALDAYEQLAALDADPNLVRHEGKDLPSLAAD